MESTNYKPIMKKISESEFGAVDYSQKVTERFLSLFRAGKIMLGDQIKAIEQLIFNMQPKTTNQYKLYQDEYTSYNGIKGAINAGLIMSFKVGDVIFIQKQ